jgi:hypothetical protein
MMSSSVKVLVTASRFGSDAMGLLTVSTHLMRVPVSIQRTATLRQCLIVRPVSRNIASGWSKSVITIRTVTIPSTRQQNCAPITVTHVKITMVDAQIRA